MPELNLFGWQPFGKRQPSMADHIAYIARTSGLAEGDPYVLAEALAVLDPHQRIEVLRTVVDKLSPAVRSMVWASAGERTGSWDAVRDSLTKEERHPKLVKAVADRACATGKLDLTEIPAGTALYVGLYRLPQAPTRFSAFDKDWIETARFRLHDGGEVEPEETLYSREAGKPLLEKQRLGVIGTLSVRGTFERVLEFGKPLFIAGELAPEEYLSFDGRRGYRSNCLVGGAELDGQSALRY